MPKVSVITPTIRPEGLKVVQDALKDQVFKDFEWIIGSKFDPQIPEAKWIKDDFTGGFWSLNRIYNKLFKEAQGELVVSLQDWIWVTPEGLQKFWDNHKRVEGVISGVGDQYERLNKWGKPEIKIWSDPRKNLNNGSFYECYWNDAEWNWCAIPKKDFEAVRGMDEQLDFLGYGGDQLECSQRMNDAGIRFYLDQTNESYTLRHGREDFGGLEEWDKNHILLNGKYEIRVKELKQTGNWPVLKGGEVNATL